MTDTSWIIGTEPTLVRQRLLSAFDMLAEHNGMSEAMKKDRTGLERLLDMTKVFDEKVIEQIKKSFIKPIDDYFNVFYDKKVRSRFISQL